MKREYEVPKMEVVLLPVSSEIITTIITTSVPTGEVDPGW